MFIKSRKTNEPAPIVAEPLTPEQYALILMRLIEAQEKTTQPELLAEPA